jgi:hypothetical protein
MRQLTVISDKAHALVALLIVLAAGAFVVTHGSPTATPRDLRVLQWDIAGVTVHPFDQSKPDNGGTLQVAQRLTDMAQARQPHLVSINEACRRQADYVREHLAHDIGPTEIQFADSAGTDYLCGYSEGTYFESGTALIAVGADEVLHRSVYYFTDDGLITSTKTGRSAACMLVSFRSTLGQAVQACSLHLDPNDQRARQQAATFADFMTEDGIPYPLVLTGDFNASPDFFYNALYAPEEGGHGQFVELDYPDNRNTFYTGVKLDYIFGDKNHSVAATNAEVVDPGNCSAFPSIDHPCSDHSALFGTLAVADVGGRRHHLVVTDPAGSAATRQPTGRA